MYDVWRTKDGREVNVNDMTTSHLTNTIKFLHKRIQDLEVKKELADFAPCCFSGEMAQYYAEQEIDFSGGKIAATIEHFLVWIKIFETELARRQSECEMPL